MSNQNSIFVNYLLSLLNTKVVVPTDFHGRCEAVGKMLEDDMSGLVDSLTDFAVETASVNYRIHTDNDQFTKLLNEWLQGINQSFLGRFPSGIKALSSEYFKERWKGSSFCALKIVEWEADASGIILPSKMVFVDGSSIRCVDKNEGSTAVSVDQYEYFLGQGNDDANRLDKNCLLSKPYCRWFDKYPVPFLIKRGIFHNWKIIEALKDKEGTLLNQIIPYMLHITKGTEGLAISKKLNYSDEKLKQVIDQVQELMDKASSNNTDRFNNSKTPIRASQFDEQIKHLIPDLEAIFKPTLFESAEKNILSGLGFIDIAEAVSSNRSESVLNPRAFIQEVESGVGDFKQILHDVVYLIKQKNAEHKKYMGLKCRVTNEPIRGFMTDKFKERMRQLWDRGLLSSQTAIEVIGEEDFELEVKRREDESRKGIDQVLYPHVADNREGVGIDTPLNEKGESAQPDAKTDPVEKKNFNKASLIQKTNLDKSMQQDMELIGSPFDSIKDIPDYVSKALPTVKQKRAWLKIFNNAYNFYKGKYRDAKRAEALAFRTANAKVKEIE